MKKLFTLLFSVSLVFFVFLSNPIQAQLPFSDGFESGSLSNWTASGDTAVSPVSPSSGLFCAKGSNTYWIEKGFAPIEENEVTVEFYMKASQDNKESLNLQVNDNADSVLVVLGFNNSGYIRAMDGTTEQLLQAYSPETWYYMKIVINQTTAKYDVYIDDVLKGENYAYLSNVTDYPSKFIFASFESASSIGWLDDVSITSSVVDYERDALIALYNATDGGNWIDNTNWNSETPLGEWYGVTTDVNTKVTEIQLDGNNLAGNIPSELGDLLSLEILQLEYNQLSGPIPSELGNFSSMTILYLNNNQLSGPIPSELGNLSSLTSLSLRENQVSGSIPSELGSLSSMQELTLSSNQLSGSIPAELGNLSSLHWLDLKSNLLSGPIPSEFGNLTSLANLYLNTNQLNEIPASMTSLVVEDFYFSENNFSFEDLINAPEGTMNTSYNPQNIIHAYDTSYLDTGTEGVINLSFDDNVINSTDIWKKDGTQIAATDSNSFLRIETLPGTYYYTLEITNTGFADFTLHIDSVIVITQDADPEKAALIALYNATDGDNWIDNTNWNSETPLGEWYGVTTDIDGHVTELNMTNNNLSGTLPSAIGDLTYLSTIRLDGHQLIGEIPVELYTMPNLIYVNLSNNYLSGELSPLIGNMPVIASYIVYNNEFTGTIPIEIGNCVTLSFLDIGDQSLTGEIPIELASLTDLYYLAIRGAGLTGSIPVELC
ncbi:MAG: hypothetical protein GQ527_03950, partial [Bacteroidales bacterium]|nr:hypothetical protein [Bacteroidales bacterium]